MHKLQSETVLNVRPSKFSGNRWDWGNRFSCYTCPLRTHKISNSTKETLSDKRLFFRPFLQLFPFIVVLSFLWLVSYCLRINCYIFLYIITVSIFNCLSLFRFICFFFYFPPFLRPFYFPFFLLILFLHENVTWPFTSALIGVFRTPMWSTIPVFRNRQS